MQKNTEKRKRKAASVLTAAVVILLFLFYAGAPLLAFFRNGVWILWVPVLIGVCVAAGVVAALCQRLREVDKGEEDEAKKY